MPEFSDKPANFIGPDGRKYLVRCPACGRENWAPAVASGTCAWCGWAALAASDGGGDHEEVTP